MEETVSFELAELLAESILFGGLCRSMAFVDKMYNKFPKEPFDCITSIILNSILEEIDESRKDMVIFLLDYLIYLKKIN